MRISSVDSCGIMHIIQSVYRKQCTFPLNLCIKSHWNRLFDTYMYKCVYTFSAILLLKRFCFVFWLYSFMLLSFLVSLYFVLVFGWNAFLEIRSFSILMLCAWLCVCVCVHLFAFSAFNSGYDCSFFHTFCHDQVWFVCSMTFGLSGASIFDFSFYCSFNILFTLFDSLKKNNREWNYSLRWKMIVERRCPGRSDRVRECTFACAPHYQKEFNNHYDW